MSIDKWLIENKFTSRELLNRVAVSIDKWLQTQKFHNGVNNAVNEH